MADETATTDTANPDAPATEEKKKLKQTVDIKDIGPCKKHIKVTVERADIDEN
jgi:trigger factor